jgi:hypothetical protein
MHEINRSGMLCDTLQFEFQVGSGCLERKTRAVMDEDGETDSLYLPTSKTAGFTQNRLYMWKSRHVGNRKPILYNIKCACYCFEKRRSSISAPDSEFAIESSSLSILNAAQSMNLSTSVPQTTSRPWVSSPPILDQLCILVALDPEPLHNKVLLPDG